MNEKELQDKIQILEQTVKALRDLVEIKDQTIKVVQEQLLAAKQTTIMVQPYVLPQPQITWPYNPQIIITPAVQPAQIPYSPFTVTCGDIAVQSGGTTGIKLETNNCVSCWQTPEQIKTYGVWCNDHNSELTLADVSNIAAIGYQTKCQ